MSNDQAENYLEWLEITSRQSDDRCIAEIALLCLAYWLYGQDIVDCGANSAAVSCVAAGVDVALGPVGKVISKFIGKLVGKTTKHADEAVAGGNPGPAATSTEAKPIAVIGRLPDTSVAKAWPGHEVLDIPDWTIAKNDQWVQSVIDRKMPVYVGSPTTWPNLWDATAGRSTVFGRELSQVLNAGYTWDGWMLVPSGGG